MKLTQVITMMGHCRRVMEPVSYCTGNPVLMRASAISIMRGHKGYVICYLQSGMPVAYTTGDIENALLEIARRWSDDDIDDK